MEQALMLLPNSSELLSTLAFCEASLDLAEFLFGGVLPVEGEQLLVLLPGCHELLAHSLVLFLVLFDLFGLVGNAVGHCPFGHLYLVLALRIRVGHVFTLWHPCILA